MSFSDDDGATSMANTMDGAAISEPRVNDDDARSLWSLARGGAPLYDSLYPAELVVVIEKHFPINAIDMCKHVQRQPFHSVQKLCDFPARPADNSPILSASSVRLKRMT